MKRMLIAILAALFLSGISLAQDQVPASQQGQNSATHRSQAAETQPVAPQSAPASPQQATDTNRAPRFSPGSVIPVQLTKSIDAKKVKSGDEVLAKVTEDLKATNGEVVVRKDTKVVGHVTAAQARSKEQKESDVGIAFDHAVLKDGSEINMPLSIQAIIAPPNMNPANTSGGGGYEQPAGMPSGGGVAPGGNVGRPAGMGGATAAPPATAPPSGLPAPTGPQKSNSASAPITAKTQGVVGISNLKLMTAAPNPKEGSLVSSEKNNVKLESGTLMLLRVN